MRAFIRNLLDDLPVLIVVLAIVAGVSYETTEDQRESCERVNVVRSVLHRFLDSASSSTSVQPSSVKQEYGLLMFQLERVPYTPPNSPQVDCEEAFQWPW